MASSTGGRPDTQGMDIRETASPNEVPTRNSGKMKPPRKPESTVRLMASSLVAAMTRYLDAVVLRLCAVLDTGTNALALSLPWHVHVRT